jgi:hypothetical protein
MGTTLAQLIEIKMGRRKMVDYIEAQRAAGASWDNVARGLWQLTDVSVTGETLRQWHQASADADG